MSLEGCRHLDALNGIDRRRFAAKGLRISEVSSKREGRSSK